MAGGGAHWRFVLAAAIARRGGEARLPHSKTAEPTAQFLPRPGAADSHPLRTHCRGYDAPSIPLRGPLVQTWAVIFQPRQLFVNADG
jgi:hypothetical protein